MKIKILKVVACVVVIAVYLAALGISAKDYTLINEDYDNNIDVVAELEESDRDLEETVDQLLCYTEILQEEYNLTDEEVGELVDAAMLDLLKEN